jgi:tetratricopeptide (TPR) repeat protein
MLCIFRLPEERRAVCIAIKKRCHGSSPMSASVGNRVQDPLTLALAQRELAYTLCSVGSIRRLGPCIRRPCRSWRRNSARSILKWLPAGIRSVNFRRPWAEYDKAVSLYRKSLAILEHTKGREHPALAVLLDKLAALCMELEMEKEAVPLYERLVRIREQALRPTHPQLALSLNNLAESYRLQGQYVEAEACYQKSLRHQ